MPNDCEYLRLQLLIEYNRVLAWGKAAGLVEVPEGSNLGVTLGTNATELCAVIGRIGWLLAEFRDLNARYENELNPNKKDKKKDKEKDDGDSQDEKSQEVAEAKASDVDVVKQVSSLAISYEKEKKERKYAKGTGHLRGFFSKTKEIVTHPRRIQWAAVDKEAFEALLKDLHALTERLRELMGDHREKVMDEITAKTYREMVLARNEIQELRAMFGAVTNLIESSSAGPEGGKRHRNDETFRDLLKLKEISQVSEDILSQLRGNDSLDASKNLASLITIPRFTSAAFEDGLAWNDDGEGDEPEAVSRPRAVLTTKEGDIPVWIEWKNLGQIIKGSTQEREARLRTEALAEMLHKDKPQALCLPTSVGYFDDLQIYGSRRHAWIFEMPDGSNYSTTIKSLYDILGDRQYRPTLSQRISLASKLASTVLYLHTVNWLHKGIRSDNIVFHFDDDDEFDPEKPVLSGFDYSRPQSSGTTSREVDDQWNIYRWPDIQRNNQKQHGPFKKTYDVYSLGLVLLEIAHWLPLHKILALKSWPKVSLADSTNVRGWLLGAAEAGPAHFEGPNPAGELRNVAGERYWGAATRCLAAHGDAGLGVDEDADQSEDPEVGIKLQEAFTKLVVEELRAVDV
jgi:hypothetical protein